MDSIFRTRIIGKVSQINSQRYFLMLAAVILLSSSCDRKNNKEETGLSTRLTLCGSVQFDEGYGTETDSLISYGVALLHHMTYEDAEKIFDRVIETSPECFWGYWGKAMTFIHPLWPDQPDRDLLMSGQELAGKAMDYASSPREKLFGEALIAYYSEGIEKTEKERLTQTKDKWESAYTIQPEDLEAKAFYSLFLVASADPSDKTFKNQLNAGMLAMEVLEKIPDHPGGFHYSIHAYDYPELAGQAIFAAENYSNIAPDVPHALHMPTHIFTRLGQWDESISWNTRSARSALRHPVGQSVSSHYFHAVDYMVYACMQQLKDKQAERILEEIHKMEGPFQEMAATAYSLAAVEGRYYLERQQWEQAAVLSGRLNPHLDWEKFPEYEALVHFAAGLGSARSGNIAKAKEAVLRLGYLKGKPENPYWKTQIEVQETSVRAWIAFAEGEKTEALTLMRRAADIENSTSKSPVTPGELLPASEMLGDMYMDLNQPDMALEQYKIALNRSPNRFNSLYGAARAAELKGNRDEAGIYYKKLLDLTADSEITLPQKEKARKFLAAGGKEA
jgi:tetratricopeptide (TPR) repeat protein